jgi:hypothetical protein
LAGLTLFTLKVHVFISDPWHEPAKGQIDNVHMDMLMPRMGCTDPARCTRDPTASVDDGSCRPNVPGQVENIDVVALCCLRVLSDKASA